MASLMSVCPWNNSRGRSIFIDIQHRPYLWCEFYNWWSQRERPVLHPTRHRRDQEGLRPGPAVHKQQQERIPLTATPSVDPLLHLLLASQDIHLLPGTSSRRTQSRSRSSKQKASTRQKFASWRSTSSSLTRTWFPWCWRTTLSMDRPPVWSL